MPIIRNLEETLNKYLLTEKEKDNGYFFEFEYKSILKVSPQDEINTYKTAVECGLFLVDEARKKMNLPPLPKEDTLKGGEEENASGNSQQ